MKKESEEHEWDLHKINNNNMSIIPIGRCFFYTLPNELFNFV